MGLELNDWLPMGERVELARWAEDHGFTDAYVAEITDPDAFVTCALAVSATARIRLGTCIVQIGPRTAPMLASGAAAVDAAGPGRFALGIGVSSAAIVSGWHGLTFDHLLTRAARRSRRSGPSSPGNARTSPVVRCSPRGSGSFSRLPPLHRSISLPSTPACCASPVRWQTGSGSTSCPSSASTGSWRPSGRLRTLWAPAPGDPALDPVRSDRRHGHLARAGPRHPGLLRVVSQLPRRVRLLRLRAGDGRRGGGVRAS